MIQDLRIQQVHAKMENTQVVKDNCQDNVVKGKLVAINYEFKMITNLCSEISMSFYHAHFFPRSSIHQTGDVVLKKNQV